MVCRGVYIPQDDDSMVPDPQSNGHWCKTYQPHDLNDLVWQSSGWTLVGVLGSHLVNQLAIGCFKTWTFKQNMRFESTKWRETTETTAIFFFHRGWGYQVISRLEPFGYWVWHNGYGTKLYKGMFIRELQAAGLDPLLKWWLTHTQLCAEACQYWYVF